MDSLQAIEANFSSKVYEFAKEKYKFKTLRSLIKTAEEVFMSLEAITSVAIFINDAETFEFELYGSIPENYPFPSAYDYFVDKGVIGEVLSSVDTVYAPANPWQANFIILPLVSKSGVVGLCFMDVAVPISSYSSQKISELHIFASLVASSISEILSEAKIEEKTDILDQIVAMRTMHLEEKTKELNDRISSLTSNLMSSIPHEVRTPINQIIGFTKYFKAILDTSVSEDKQDLVEIISDIEESADRLKRLFENYLFHTNLVLISMNIKEIENLQKKVTYSPQSVIYETAMNLAHHYNREKDFEIELSDTPLAMYEVFLVKICEELISNAIKFSSVGQKICIKSYCEAKKYILVIKDYGQGIPSNKVETIGAYVQFDRERNEQQGLGLGLSIVNRIINVYKASWDIQSVENDHTTIMLMLPAASREQIPD